MREALLDWLPDRWLVIVTDRPEDDLGAGVLAHLVGQQLRSPDLWQAVRQRFRAVAIDAQLTAGRGQRGIAQGLLELTPPTAGRRRQPACSPATTRLGAAARTILDSVRYRPTW